MWVRDSGPPETGRSVAHELHVWDPQGLIRTWKGVWGSDVNRTSGEDWWFVCSFIENSDFFLCFLCLETMKELGELEETASADLNSQVRAC